MEVPGERTFCGRFRRRGTIGCEARGGIALAEVIVALAVLTIAALGAFSCLATAYSVDREASDAAGAQTMAYELMEKMLRAPFDSLMETYDDTQVSQRDLVATLRVRRIAPATGPAALLRLQVGVRNVGQHSDLIQIVGQRADRSAPSSAGRASP